MDERNDRRRRNAASTSKHSAGANINGAGRGKTQKRREIDAKRKDEIKDKRAQDYVNFKLGLVFCVVLLFFAVFCGKILYEQNINGEEYHRLALTQLINGLGEDRTITAARGDITDRNMTTLASSTIVYDVYLDIRMLVEQDNTERGKDDDEKDESPSLLSTIVNGIGSIFSSSSSDTTTGTTTRYTLDDTVDAICEIFELEENEVRGWLETDAEGTPINNTYYYVFAKAVSYEKKKAFEELAAETDSKGNKTHKISHVYFEESAKRTYIYSTLASPVIGFTRGDTTLGLESKYSDLLTGEDGRSFRYIDSNGDIATETVPSTDGATLITTLDAHMQEFAEELVVRYGTESQAKNAALIVMDPNTGEVITMAQYGSFDLNDPTNLLLFTDSSYTQYEDADASTKADAWESVWQNFNITYTFEPGSIFKPVTVGTALEEGIIDENYTFYCTGSVTVAGEPIPCVSVHGAQTLEQTIANSCNGAMIDIAAKTGRSHFLTYQKDFGYGSKTGIDLPAEGNGILFTESQLNVTELATSAIGQRFTCTPIQAITSFCAAINGGNVLKPYVVSKAVDADGNILMENTTTVERKVISQDVSDFLREAMQKVVTEGTGKRAAIDGYNIGGKSGTGEQGIKGTDDYAYSLSFIGYFPVENPQYVVLVTLNRVPEDVYNGGYKTATPMFREMAAEIISYKGIQPSYDVEGGSGLTANTFELSNYVDRSVTAVIEELNSSSIEYEILGSAGDTVTKQYPEAGTKMSPSGVVYLTIGGETEGLVTVPDVIGNDLNGAGKLLNDYGFVVKPYTSTSVGTTEENTEGDDEAAAETETSEADSGTMTVLRQVPDAGVKLPAGTEIRLDVQ